MRILALEPFYGGSHRLFLEGLRASSRHEVVIAGMPARKWKWRMRGAALHFAEEFRGKWGEYDLLFASDFLSLADLVGLAPGALGRMPKVVYFHENQLTYPYRDEAERDYQYAFTNVTTCMAADYVLFNSAFHRREFLDAVVPFLKRMPDFRPEGVARAIEEKSRVLHFGVDFSAMRQQPRPERSGSAVVLWNHRWEFDKAPEFFFETLMALKREGVAFRLAVAGERFKCTPEIFERAQEALSDCIEHFGYLPSRAAYVNLLRRCDIVCSTAIHEFFGVAMVEAIAAGCRPLLPERLSYPEVLPSQVHGEYLYRTDAEFRKKLRWAIENVAEIRGKDTSSLVEGFGWDRLAVEYDRMFDGAAMAMG